MLKAKYWIEFAEDWRDVPLAFWGHVEQDGKPWFSSQSFKPAAPCAVPHKDFAVLCVEFGETVLRFSSPAQLAECIRVLSLTPLPSSTRLSALRGTHASPNQHWVSRLPAQLKAPKTRPQLVAALLEASAAKCFPTQPGA